MAAEERATPSMRDVPVANLLFDQLNPRLDEQTSQRDAHRAIVVEQGDKLLALADDIADRGLDPSTLSIGIPDAQDPGRIIVLEGNRRLAALRSLINPDTILDLLEARQAKRLRDLSAKYLADPVRTIRCVIFQDREEASHWIWLRHRGEVGGRGIAAWGAVESTRFESRRGKDARYAAALHAMDLVRASGGLDEEALQKFGDIPITTVQRLLNDPDARKKLGIEIENGRIKSRITDAEALKGLARIIRDAATGKLPVSVVDTKKDREEYLDGFSKSDLPSPSAKQDAAPHEVGAAGETATGTGAGHRKRTRQTTRTRTKLVPPSCKLTISDTKTNNIYDELRRLNVNEFPHAVGVLFRVFLELSVDRFVRESNLMTKAELDNAKLKQKLTTVATHLRSTGVSKNELTAVNRATDPNHFLASSVTTLHAYVHGSHFSPSPMDLKTAWDSLEPFLKMICT